MADQPGFFDQLRGGSEDLDTLASRQRDAAAAQSGSRTFNQYYQLGSQAGSGLGRVGAQVLGKGQQARDNEAAHAAGISVNEVRTRRRLQNELSRVEDDGSFEARMKMATLAAKIANEEGDGAGLARALGASQRLAEEKAEFDKLGADAKKAEFGAIEAGLVTAYDENGNPTSGKLAIGKETGLPGILVEENGQLVHKPYGENFTEVDPTKLKAGESQFGRLADIGTTIKRNRGIGFAKMLDGLASSANTSIMKTDRVLSTLTDLYEKGGVESVIGTSGGLIIGIDNLVRNVGGVISAFSARGQAEDNKPGFTPDGKERTFAGKAGLVEMAQDAANSFSTLIQLPPGVEATSAAAQQHRAAVMEMAYMAARLAEPSNRGLSDNDIKNALARIAGDTSNPQVMMRRFMEMQVDASQELDFELSKVHGSLGPGVTNDEINMALLGQGYQQYKDRKDALFTKFGATPQEDGRVVFGADSIIGVDVQPGEGTGVAPEQVQDIKEMSNEDAAAALGL